MRTLALTLVLTSVTGCDLGTGEHNHDVRWREARAPAFTGEGVVHTHGWKMSWDACPSGLELSPLGDKLTVGGWNKIHTVSLGDVPQTIDWGFRDHEYVNSGGMGPDGETVLVTDWSQMYQVRTDEAFEGGIPESVPIVPDASVNIASVSPAGVHAIAVRDTGACALIGPDGDATDIGCETDWVAEVGHDAGTDTTWLLQAGSLRRVDGRRVIDTEVAGSVLAVDQMSGVAVTNEYLDDYGADQGLVGLDALGRRVWTRDIDGQVLYAEETAVGIVVVVSTSDSRRARVRFLDAATGAVARPPIGLEVYPSYFTVSGDAQRFALLDDYAVHVFQVSGFEG